ncbi:6-bladed beta-propeller [Gemmatimonadota bacterium]
MSCTLVQLEAAMAQRIITTITVIAWLLASGCTDRGLGEYDFTGQWEADQSTDDLVTTVHTRTGSVWGGRAELQTELSIGDDDKGEQYVFGFVGGAVLGDNCILVLDAQVPALRKYDLSGRYIRDVGRQGGGPGEFQRPDFISVHPVDGRVFVPDTQQSRVNIYAPDGEYLDSWRVPPNYYIGGAQVVTANDVFYHYRSVRGPYPMPDIPMGMVGFGASGAVGDTLIPGESPVETPALVGYRPDGGMFASMDVPFFPDFHWAITPGRELIRGFSADYRFEIIRSDGSVIIVSRRWNPVLVKEDEARWHREALLVFFRSFRTEWEWDGPEIPDRKPAFDLFFADLDGRIWVIRPGEGHRIEGCADPPTERRDRYDNPCWRDEVLVDVFDNMGRYLGPVAIPEGFAFYPPPYVKGDQVVGVVQVADGSERVVKCRLVTPEAR